MNLQEMVKKVIDEFDLYVLLPGIDAPLSEYNPESNSITKKITYGMSVDDIANVIRDVFSYYFGSTYSLEVYMGPAKQIYTYLKHLYSDEDKNSENKQRCYVIDEKWDICA